jgi:hypothetical protein
MTVFGGEGGSQTPTCGQMFGPAARNAAGVSTSNIAPPSGSIATGLSFFVRYFLAKPMFSERQNPSVSHWQRVENPAQNQAFWTTYPHLACG